MAYSTATPPQCLDENIIGNFTVWVYKNSDAQATVAGAGYFTNAVQLGMQVGDWVVYSRTGTVSLFSYTVLSFTGSAANLSTGVAIS